MAFSATRHRLLVPALLSGLSMSVASAACIGEGDILPAELERRSFLDPSAALPEIASRLVAGRESGNLPLDQRAALHAMAAEAYRQLGRSAELMAESRAGLEVWDVTGHSPLSARLRAIHAMALAQNSDGAAALREIDAAIAEYSSDRRTHACLLNDRGWLRYRDGNIEGALHDLIAAHETLRTVGAMDEAMVAAGRLAAVYRVSRYDDEAAVLVRDSIEHFEKLGAWVRVATGRSRLGWILADQQKFGAALEEFLEMRGLSERARDPLGVAYADIAICAIQITQREFALADATCRRAESLMRAVGPVDAIDRKTLAAHRGRLALGVGQPSRALQFFNDALKGNESDLEKALVVKIFGWRAEAESELGDHRAAYADLQRQQREATTLMESATANQVALLRVKFSLDRERQRVEALQEEQATLAAQIARDRQLRNVIVIGLIIVAAVAILLAVAIQRRRGAEASRRAAERRLEELGRLTAGIAHDFNNLMTVVQQAAGQLGRHPALQNDQGAQEMLNATRSAAETGGDITRQLLAFGRQQELRPENTFLDEYFFRHRTLMEQSAGSGSSFSMQVERGISIRVDPAQLTSALVNLIVNAREATHASGQISLRAFLQYDEIEPQHTIVCIAVSDNGAGMRPEVAARATEAFFSTKEPGAGAGLGLSAVDGFVRQSGGRMKIASTPGAGTTVTLMFPAASSD